MKRFHIATAVIEVATGILLVMAPAFLVTLLLGSSLTTPVESVLARVAGVALVALGLACWLARDDVQSRAGRGLAGAMLVHNTGVAVVLAYASIGLGLSAIGLWPAVLLHTAMAIWCAALLLKSSPRRRQVEQPG